MDPAVAPAPQPYGAGWMQTSALSTSGSPTALGRVAGGAAAAIFFASNMIALAVAVSVAIAVMGLGNILFNTDNAFTTWVYWRIYFPTALAVFAAPLIIWLNYQLRKGPSVAGRAVGFFNQGVVNILYFVISAILLVIAVYVAFCLVWYGVTDLDACATHPLCNPNSQASGKTPIGAGAIMIVIGWGMTVLLICIELVMQLYLWYASRQVVTMSVLNDPYVHLADEIHSELEDQSASSFSTGWAPVQGTARPIYHKPTEEVAL